MERDIQAGLEMGWHNLTTIVPVVTKEVAHPYEVIPCEIAATRPGEDPIPLAGKKILIASDDLKPIGSTYEESYVPNSIESFWNTIEDGLGDTPYQIVSAGSLENRNKIFASIKITDGFKIGEREFKDFISLIDSFDKSMSFRVLYSNICVVCSNTFNAVMNRGNNIARAKHSKGFEGNRDRMVEAIDEFAGTSARFKALMEEAHIAKTEEQEARCWIAGVDADGQKSLSLGDLRKIARMTELFRHGKGNKGETRLDAFQGLTEYHTHESTRLKESNSQWLTSEFGASARVKTRALDALQDWQGFRDRGHKLLKEAGALIGG